MSLNSFTMETDDETDVKKKYYCEICNKRMNGETQFDEHNDSRGHKDKAAKQKCNIHFF